MLLAKSIDELYAEVKDYDLVICNDAPLALALNNRLDKPIIGHFAVTPRELSGQLASDILGRPILDGIEVIKRVSLATGYKLRYVHGEIENFKRIRRYKSDVRQYLRGRKSKTVYDEYILLPTLERAMEAFDTKMQGYFDGLNVAIIGLELFDELDKHVIPQNFTEIELFAERMPRQPPKQYRIKEIRELSNDRQIAENMVSLIDRDNASDIAIVLNVGDRIADAVKSALYRRRIPFINNLNVRDLSNIRDFLEFLSLSLTFNTVKISQIRELISSYGGWIPSKYDEYLAEQYYRYCQNDRTKELLNVMENIRSMTFSEVYKSVVGAEGQVKLLLNEMELNDSTVTQSDTDDMIYAVNNFNDLKHNEQIPEYEKEGVLLVDCKNSVYIDRPVVFYIGLGSEWDSDLSDLNLVDYNLKDDVIERNTVKFQILLQQGTSRIYAVNSVRNGERPKPCSLFEHAEDDRFVFTDFRQVCDDLIAGSWYEPEEPEQIRAGVDEIDHTYVPKPFSKTSYSNYASCPRGYMFGNLVGTPDNSSTVMGNLIHEYAEFRICFPDEAKEKGIEHYVDAISEECLGLFTPDIRELKRSYVRSALINIDRFVDRFGFSARVKLGKKKADQKPNRFFEEIGQGTNGSQMTEIEVTSKESHMRGILDLLDGTVTYDFKTGSPHDIKKIKAQMDIKNPNEYKDFQPLFYLALLDDNYPGKNEFILFYAGENSEKMALGNDYSIDQNIRHVKLIDDAGEYLKEHGYDDIYAKYAKYDFLEDIQEEFFEEITRIGLTDLDALMSSESIARISAATGNKVKDSIYLDAVKKLKTVIGQDIIEGKGALYVTRKGLNDFKNDVSAAYEEVAPMFFTDFPARPRIKCEKCHFKDICMEEPIAGGDSDE